MILKIVGRLLWLPLSALLFALLVARLPVTSAEPFDVEARLTASDAAENDNFGWSVAISGNTAIVGAAWDDDAGSKSGSAYMFTPEPSSFLLAAIFGLFGLAAPLRRRRK